MAELSHQQARSLILSAGDAGLLPPDEAALAAHLESCSECQAYVRSLEITRQKLRNTLRRRWDRPRVGISFQKIHSGVRRNNMSKKMSLTAGTLAMLAVVALVVVGLSNTRSPQANAATGPATLTLTAAPTTTDLPTPTAQPPLDYTVRSGDVCSSIALAFDVSVQSLIVVNNLSADCTLSVGDHLKIPHPTATPARATTPGTTRTPVRLGKGAILPYVRWSPDGQRLVIHSADDLLFYLVDRDGSGLSRLSDLQAWDARWSADGRAIRICQEQTGKNTFKVFSVSPAGSNLTELPAEEAVAAVLDGHCPSTWSPDRKTIAFVKNDGLGLYFVDANGQNIRQVVAPDLVSVNVLKWSMDSSGSSLIFSGLDPVKTGASTGIYTTQIDNAGHIVSRTLLHLLTVLENFSWMLSPDGQKIIYVPGEPNGIYMANVVNSGAWTRLTDLYVTSLDAENLQWSPDGSQIAFSSNVNGDLDIFVVGADGTGLRYYPNPGSSEQPVGWSPDGQSLVFSAQAQEGQTPISPIALYLIDVKDLTAYGTTPTATQ